VALGGGPDRRAVPVVDTLNEPAGIRVGIVPHTHWDREWHVPFQAGRLRLVRLLDSVLGLLERGDLPFFWLDGQTAAVDDYLAVRPEAEGRVRAAVAAGRLGIGRASLRGELCSPPGPSCRLGPQRTRPFALT